MNAANKSEISIKDFDMASDYTNRNDNHSTKRPGDHIGKLAR
jgi:hypothetical protein